MSVTDAPSNDHSRLTTGSSTVPAASSTITIDIPSTVKVLMAITSTIVLISMTQRLAGLGINRLDVDQEASVGTLWTGLQFGILILFLLARTALAHRAGEKWKPWFVVAMCAGYVMADDVITIHEATTEPLRSALGTSGFLTFAWILPYSLLTMIVAITLFPWVRTLHPTTRKGMFLAAGVFLAGAVVMEGVGGILIDAGGQASVTDGAGFTSTKYMLSTTLEEFLEMAGVAIAVGAVMFDLTLGGAFGLRVSPLSESKSQNADA